MKLEFQTGRNAALAAMLVAAGCVLGTPDLALGQVAKKAGSPTPFQDLFIELDANSDRVIELSEVPKSAHAAFQRLIKHGDSNHDGKLEATEYRDLLQKVNFNAALTPEERERRFKNLDKNGDGKLDRQEFQGGPARFDILDRNGDGFLSRDELPWMNPGAGAGGPGPEAKQAAAGPGVAVAGLAPGRLELMDKNSDGRVSREEFTGRPAMFDRLDLNHDGFLDQADRKLAQAAAAKKAIPPDPPKTP